MRIKTYRKSVLALTVALIVAPLHAEPEADDKKPDGQTNELTAKETTFQTSQKAWNALREKTSGNYTYRAKYCDMEYTAEYTVITVKDNKVVERRKYTRDRVEGKDELAEPRLIYAESGEDLGSHKNGAPLKTIDDYYAEASKYLQTPTAEMQYDKRGLLIACMHHNDSCPSAWYFNYIDDAPKPVNE